jgi:hypothetical protein
LRRPGEEADPDPRRDGGVNPSRPAVDPTTPNPRQTPLPAPPTQTPVPPPQFAWR